MSTLVTRKIIKIDEDKCDGCGLCVDACHEGAIQLVNGKAKLVRDDYCDGLGDCLGECPQGAISFEVREAAPYDEDAVQEHLARRDKSAPAACPSVRAMLDAIGGKDKLPCGCPSTQARKLERDPVAQTAGSAPSALTNWPTQLALVPPNAPYLREADLLISADCVPFAYGGFHNDLVPGRVVLQACPKLDETGPYVQKLAAIFQHNDIQSITLARMEVPCCGGLVNVVRSALALAGKQIPVEVVTLGVDGAVRGRQTV